MQARVHRDRGTVLERSKVPLTKWWLAAHMLNQGKKGASAHEIHRSIGVSYKTAWFMMHRLREAMTTLNPTAMGGDGSAIQSDETYQRVCVRYSNRSASA